MYGDAITYSLSLGYRKSPEVYTDYRQANTNVYLEFIGKAFQTAKVYQAGEKLKINTVALKGTRTWRSTQESSGSSIQIFESKFQEVLA